MCHLNTQMELLKHYRILNFKTRLKFELNGILSQLKWEFVEHEIEIIWILIVTVTLKERTVADFMGDKCEHENHSKR